MIYRPAQGGWIVIGLKRLTDLGRFNEEVAQLSKEARASLAGSSLYAPSPGSAGLSARQQKVDSVPPEAGEPEFAAASLYEGVAPVAQEQRQAAVSLLRVLTTVARSVA